MAMAEVFYVQCSECGHVFEVVTTEDELMADGYVPSYADPEDGYVWERIPHREGCDASLIIAKTDIPQEG